MLIIESEFIFVSVFFGTVYIYIYIGYFCDINFLNWNFQVSILVNNDTDIKSVCFLQ